MNLRLLVMSVLALSGCVTIPAVSSNLSVDPAARPQCEQHCSVLGLKMTAVVIYSNRTGCVCEAADAPAVASTKQAAVAAAGEVVNEEEEAQRQRDADRRRRASHK